MHSERAEIRKIVSEWYPQETVSYKTGHQQITFRSKPFGPLRKMQGRLLEIARDSDEARALVISTLIEVLQTPKVRTFSGYRLLWYLICDSLGELKATEAIDVLANSLDLDDGLSGLSMFYRPFVLGLAKIGPPAIPKLQNVLISPEATRLARIRAVEALGSIGGSEAQNVLRDALRSETDEFVRSGIESWLRTR